MQIISPAFENNEKIPVKYTCDGENISPPLKISGVPAGAKSLLLIMDDPDSPAGTWVHWTAWNLKPRDQLIEENALPAGSTEGLTSFGNNGYGGPCPPSGTHRYFFKIYALDCEIGHPVSAQKSDLEAAMKGHIIQSAELIGIYKR